MRTSQFENQGLKLRLKQLLLPSGPSIRRIQTGPLTGIAMEMDFAHHTQRWLGLQERELHSWLRRLTPGIHTAIDVGANDGMYTLYFLSKTAAQNVYAFEPDRSYVDQMRKNLALNGFENNPRFELLTQAVGSNTDGQTVTLDSFLSRIEFPCLIKVDIDGGEASLLEGARNLLASTRVCWIIEVHSTSLQEQCLEIVRLADYKAVVVRNAWWRHFLPELRPGDLNQWIIACR